MTAILEKAFAYSPLPYEGFTQRVAKLCKLHCSAHLRISTNCQRRCFLKTPSNQEPISREQPDTDEGEMPIPHCPQVLYQKR